MRFSWSKILPGIFLFFIALLFFLPYLSSNKIPYEGDLTGSDLTELNLPYRFLAKEALRQGHVPLWTNAFADGFPLLAEGQAGVFYPLNILFVVLPFSSKLAFFENKIFK